MFTRTLRTTHHDGFTLLEVMIALGITGALLVTLLYTLNQNIDIAARHEAITLGVMLGREKLTEMRKHPAAESGEFEAPYTGYTYKTEIKPSPYPGISEFSVAVSHGGEQVILRELFYAGTTE